jgi:tetratricopeptide (TPR) repeat protein
VKFFGLEEVNELIACGAKVVSIQAGGAYLQKLGEEGAGEDELVRLVLTGGELKVLLDESEVRYDSLTDKHNDLFEQGSDLIRPYMQLVGSEYSPADSEQAREELERGISLLRQSIAIHPENWSAYWIIGKAYQALNDVQQAYQAFLQAFELCKTNPDVAREYMFEALKLGKAENGIKAAQHAVSLKQDNAGLVANLALAYFIGGQLDDALKAVEHSLAISPEDQITKNLKDYIEAVKEGRMPQPKTLLEMDPEAG